MAEFLQTSQHTVSHFICLPPKDQWPNRMTQPDCSTAHTLFSWTTTRRTGFLCFTMQNSLIIMHLMPQPNKAHFMWTAVVTLGFILMYTWIPNCRRLGCSPAPNILRAQGTIEVCEGNLPEPCCPEPAYSPQPICGEQGLAFYLEPQISLPISLPINTWIHSRSWNRSIL